eukprot:NP_493921.2 Uncharacterized protein CELE_W09B6.5 [Caenorhabditis elegans]
MRDDEVLLAEEMTSKRLLGEEKKKKIPFSAAEMTRHKLQSKAGANFSPVFRFFGKRNSNWTLGTDFVPNFFFRKASIPKTSKKIRVCAPGLLYEVFYELRSYTTRKRQSEHSQELNVVDGFKCGRLEINCHVADAVHRPKNETKNGEFQKKKSVLLCVYFFSLAFNSYSLSLRLSDHFIFTFYRYWCCFFCTLFRVKIEKTHTKISISDNFRENRKKNCLKIFQKKFFLAKNFYFQIFNFFIANQYLITLIYTFSHFFQPTKFQHVL